MNRIAVIGIIVEEPQEVEKLNQLLHEYGSYRKNGDSLPGEKDPCDQHRDGCTAGYNQCSDRQDRKTGRNLGKSSLLEIGDMHEQRHTE